MNETLIFNLTEPMGEACFYNLKSVCSLYISKYMTQLSISIMIIGLFILFSCVGSGISLWKSFNINIDHDKHLAILGGFLFSLLSLSLYLLLVYNIIVTS